MTDELPSTVTRPSSADIATELTASGALDALFAKIDAGEVELTGDSGFIPGLIKAALERGLEAELTEHLGYEKGDPEAGLYQNSRNGYGSKTIGTEVGDVELSVPRDRDGSFTPRLVPKGQRRLGGLGDMIISLYAGGMTVRDIEHHLASTIGTELSRETISKITDEVLDEVYAWQQRPLEAFYPVIYLDALVIKVRDGAHVRNKAAHIAIGVDMDGVSPDGRVVVVAAQEIGGAGPDPAHDDRLVSLLVEHLRAYRWNATATTMDGRAYVLVELHEEAARSSLGHILDDCLIRASRSLGVPLKAGLSDELTVDSDLPAGKLQADQCLDLSPTESSVVFFEDVQARVLLSDIKQFVAGRRSAVTPAFQRLIDHDREYHTEYVPTLRAYFDGFGDTAVVGAQMHVHNNTVRYRLRRIAELSQVDLGDPESRLALQLQIYAHDN